MTHDTIVIGSGPGGLVAALALARRGQRVLVVEQHYLPGGWSHSFALGGYRFSPGIHYLGDLGAGQSLRRILEGVGLSGEVDFCEMNPDAFDHFLIAGERFDVPKGFGPYLARLLERFPDERVGLLRYHQVLFQVLKEIRSVDSLLNFPEVLLVPFKAPALLRWGFRSLGTLLDACVKDPMARAVLTAQVGNHGLAPSQVSLGLHAAMHVHYHNGAFYPRGGAKRLPQAMIKVLRRHGGEIRVRARVDTIRIENGRATGVVLAGGEFLPAKNVISNADPHWLYTRLLPKASRGGHERKARRMNYTFSCMSLFCAVDMDMRGRGFDSGNYWYYRHTDIDAIYKRAQLALPGDQLDVMFVSVPTLKDPEYRPNGHHLLEAFTFVPYAPFERWAGTHPDERDAGYAALKHKLGEQMLDTLEAMIPGVRASLKFHSVATPLANDFYCATVRGAVYGTAKTASQIGPLSFSIKTPVPNVFQCGASTFSHGYAGAAYSGIFAAARVLGEGSPMKLMSPMDNGIRVFPSEDPDSWVGHG